MGTWAELAKSASAELPETMEAVEPKRALPGLRKPWRQLEPIAVFTSALHGAGRRLALEGFREAETAHRAIVREIERAREVVTFAIEAAGEEGEAGKTVAAEGIANAIALLQYQRQSIGPIRERAESCLTRSIAATFLESHIALEQGRLGLLTHLSQEAGERGARRLWHLGVVHGRRAVLESWSRLKRPWNWTLFTLGLQTPPAPPLPAVARAPHLDQSLEFRLVPLELPAIYRRLFRLDPLDDSRLLVGRDDEMAGLIEARCFWMIDRKVSVLVLGARGSGKTSLLNCAVQSAFTGLELHRAEFNGRLTTPDSIAAFLRESYRTPARDGLEKSPRRTPTDCHPGRN